jgi:hypothetical protein
MFIINRLFFLIYNEFRKSKFFPFLQHKTMYFSHFHLDLKMIKFGN